MEKVIETAGKEVNELSLIHIYFTIVYNPKSFTDLGNHAWADDAITRLAARGIINGITATTYGPARNITRADLSLIHI